MANQDHMTTLEAVMLESWDWLHSRASHGRQKGRSSKKWLPGSHPLSLTRVIIFLRDLSVGMAILLPKDISIIAYLPIVTFPVSMGSTKIGLTHPKVSPAQRRQTDSLC